MKRLWKKGWIVLLCLLLSACSTSIKNEDFYKNINSILFSVSKSNDIPKANMDKVYFKYHLPYDIKRIKSTYLSEVLKCNNDILVMNFKTISFIKNAYYTNSDEEVSYVDVYTEEELNDLVQQGKLELDTNPENEEKKQDVKEIDYHATQTKFRESMIYTGVYHANYDKDLNYTLSVRKSGNMCYMYLDGTIATFACYVPYVECDDMIYRMFYIMKSLEYNKEDIIKNYSLLYSLKTMEDLEDEDGFKYDDIPNSGYLEDLINRTEND